MIIAFALAIVGAVVLGGLELAARAGSPAPSSAPSSAPTRAPAHAPTR